MLRDLGIEAVVALVICGVSIALLLWLAWEDDKEWARFSAAHKCKVVSKSSASTGVGTVFGGDGKVGVGVATIPGKTGWLCDDGITYYR